jgi:lipopolysaccharide export system permease protein
MGILTRFVLRTCLAPFLFSFSVITGLLFLNAVAQRLEDLTGKGLDWRTIVDFMVLSLPHTVALTLPMATLVAVLYAFAELTAHNEFTAMKAGGIQPARLLLPLIGVGFILAEVMFIFNDQVLPEANHRLKDLLVDLGRKSPTFELREQVVNEIQAADGLNPVYLTATHIDNVRNQLENVVIYDAATSGAHRTTYADSGSMAFNAGRTDLFLTLHEGTVLETDPDHPGAFRQLSFHKQIVPLRGVGNELERRAAEGDRGDREMTTAMLNEEIEVRRKEIETVGLESAEQSRNIVRSALKHLDIPGETPPPSTGAVLPGASPGYSFEFQSDPLVDEAATNARTSALHRQALEQRINQFSVEIYKKYALSFACVVFVLIGAPLAVRYPQGGLGVVIAASSAIFAISWIGLIGGENLADRGIAPPGVAMWAPNLIFLVVGLWLVSRMGTESATMRGGGWDELLWTLRSRLGRFGRSPRDAD